MSNSSHQSKTNPPSDSESQDEGELITYTLLPIESTSKTNTPSIKDELPSNPDFQNNKNQITGPLSGEASAKTPTNAHRTITRRSKPSTSRGINYNLNPIFREANNHRCTKNLSVPTDGEYESIAGGSILYSAVQHPITSQPSSSQSSIYQEVNINNQERRFMS